MLHCGCRMCSCVTTGTLMEMEVSVVEAQTVPYVHGQTAGRHTIEMIQIDEAEDVE